eukprot:gene4088-5836_t
MKLKEADVDLTTRKINVISSSPNLDKILKNYQEIIGGDYDGYRNHIYRVLSYSLHFLDGDASQEGKVLKYLLAIEAALVFHDIGLWTDRQLSYLEPSTFRANQELGSIYSNDELELVSDIIKWHHKITPFVGKNAAIVNAVRKADWVDATMGLVNYGMPLKHLNTVNNALSESDFHATLVKIGPRYYGYNIIRIVIELSSIFKW